MATKSLNPEDASRFIKEALYKVTVIFPQGAPMPCYANRVSVRHDGTFSLADCLAELPNIVEGIRLGCVYIHHDALFVYGGMVTWFPMREGIGG